MANKAASVFDVANYLLCLGEKSKRPLTHKKLHKLLYYAQAWSLVLNGGPMFNESIEAWIHGPVIPVIYARYKKFRSKAINEKHHTGASLTRQNKEVLDEVWRIYGKYDADYLELLTHREDPWIHARNEIDANEASTIEISNESMKRYYSLLLQKVSDVPKI